MVFRVGPAMIRRFGAGAETAAGDGGGSGGGSGGGRGGGRGGGSSSDGSGRAYPESWLEMTRGQRKHWKQRSERKS